VVEPVALVTAAGNSVAAKVVPAATLVDELAVLDILSASQARYVG
jgi:hypothetical protein